MKRLQAAPEEADIVDLTHEAAGVARIDGKTVFVADALPGERRAPAPHAPSPQGRLRRHGSSAARERRSRACHAARISAPAAAARLQHLAPAAQLAFKQAQLIENLSRLGGVQPDAAARAADRAGLVLPPSRASRHQARAAQGQGAGRVPRAVFALRHRPAGMPRPGRARRRADHAARAAGRVAVHRRPRAAGRGGRVATTWWRSCCAC